MVHGVMRVGVPLALDFYEGEERPPSCVFVPPCPQRKRSICLLVLSDVTASRITAQTYFYDLKFTCYQMFCYCHGNWPRTSFCIICVELIVRLQDLTIRCLSVRFLVQECCVSLVLRLGHSTGLHLSSRYKASTGAHSLGGLWLQRWPSFASVAVVKYPKIQGKRVTLTQFQRDTSGLPCWGKVWPRVKAGHKDRKLTVASAARKQRK